MKESPLFKKKLTWKRASETFTESGLWGSNGITPEDVRQGLLGNCWFLSAASALAEKPGRVENLFLNLDSAQNAAGIYGVNLYALGVPHTIIVDDYVPVTTIWDAKDKKNVETTVFNRISRDGALWMTILEKAFAKFHGNYKHIEAGDIR